MASAVPEKPQRGCQRQTVIYSNWVGAAVIESSAYVVEVGFEPVEPRCLVGSAPFGLGPVGDREEPLEVAAPKGLGFSRVLEFLQAILADGLEQLIPSRAKLPYLKPTVEGSVS